MTKIVFYRNGEQLVGYVSTGHAGYAKNKPDIVCAAVSVLEYTCVNSLESVCGIVPHVMVDEDEGSFSFRLPSSLSDGQQHDSQILMRALKQGISDLAEQYPRNIKFSIEEWRKSL